MCGGVASLVPAKEHFSTRPKRVSVALLSIALAVSVGSLPACAQELGLDGAASRLSEVILAKTRGQLTKPSVLVMDFIESHGGVTELGTAISQEFIRAMAKHADYFHLADREDYFASFRIERLVEKAYGQPGAEKCGTEKPRPTIVVDGYLDSLTDAVPVRIKATDLMDSEVIFDERVSLPLTPDRQALAAKPLSFRGMLFATGGMTWERPGSPFADGGANVPFPKASDTTYKGPKFLEAPKPEYTEAATVAKIQGSVTLNILVDAQGFPARVVIVKGLPCGLSERAIEAVSRWKLTPATGPDGKPVALWVSAEVTYHLY